MSFEARPPVLRFTGGQLQGLDDAGEIVVSVPLLMADLLYLSASSRSEVVDKEPGHYLLALATRNQSAETTGDGTPLEEVWLLYTAQVEHGCLAAYELRRQLKVTSFGYCFSSAAAEPYARPSGFDEARFLRLGHAKLL